LLKDANGDGKTWTQQLLYTGFFQGNQQLRVNGLRWGLDNWVYCATAPITAAMAPPLKSNPSSPEIWSRSAAATFRFQPDTGELDPQSGPAQFGRNPDNWGNWFGVQNSWPLWHYVLQDHYIRAIRTSPRPIPSSKSSAKKPTSVPLRQIGKAFPQFQRIRPLHLGLRGDDLSR